MLTTERTESQVKTRVAWSPVEVWGLPLAPLTMEQVIDEVNEMVHTGDPHFIITANLNYAMLTDSVPNLDAVNREAAIVTADGMPLVWASQWKGCPLPERVAGSDLVPALCQLAAEKGYRVFLLGGAPGVAAQAAANLKAKYADLEVAGIIVPPFRDLTSDELQELIDEVRVASPEILFMASSQPKGEIWLRDNYKALGVPVALQIGGSLDFAAGRVSRAPKWVGRIGMEWAYRLAMEPKRLAYRYWLNTKFLFRAFAFPSSIKSTGKS